MGCAANEVCLTGACSRYRFVTAWGSEGNGDDQFSALHAIALDSADNVYAADTGNHRVQKFESNGAFITKWGKENNAEGTGTVSSSFPEGIAVAVTDTVFVSDHNNARVQTFDLDGVHQDTWPAAVNGSPFTPGAIAVDSASNAFVVDQASNHTVKFDSNGAFVVVISNQINTLSGVAVDGEGNVFVADSGNNRVEKFAPATLDPDEYEHVGTIGGPGDGDGQFDLPFAVDVDGEGNVFVADAGHDRIQKFAPNAQDFPDQYDFVTAWGSSGTGDGQFDEPLDVAVAADGSVFVVDFRNFRIPKFAPVT